MSYTLFALRFADMLISSYESFLNLVNSQVNSVVDWLDGNHNNWIFVCGSYIPVNAAYFNSSVNYHIVNYLYNSTGLTLKRYNVTNVVHNKLPWLSANIVCNEKVYSMDNFLKKFTFDADGAVPNPRAILSTWSLYTKVWFSPVENVVFEIIDNNGNCIKIPVFDMSTEEFDTWSTFFPVVEEEAEDEDEAEDEAEGKNEADDEAEDEAESKNEVEVEEKSNQANVENEVATVEKDTATTTTTESVEDSTL